MLLFLILTALLWFSLFNLFFLLTRKLNHPSSLREIFLLSWMAIGLLVLFISEGLSLFTLLTPQAVKIAWSVVFVFSIGGNVYLCGRQKESSQAFGAQLREAINAFKRQPWQHYLLLALVAVTVAATLLTIEFNPKPTNGDVLRYHLSRILEWLQQADLNHFATQNLPQISFPPLAEYMVMHVMILTGSDDLSRIVQWIAMLVMLVAISQIAKKLGADARQQLVTTVLVISIPMLINEASNTMNDLVVGAWLAIFIYFGLCFKHQPKNLFYTAAVGTALGLALVTKSTAFIFAFPFAIWLAVGVIRKEGFGPLVWKAGGIIVGVILLINAAQFTRNTITFGQPLGYGSGTINEVFSVRGMLSNAIRNVQMQMPGSDPAFPDWVNFIADGIKTVSIKLQALTGLDPQDPRYTYNGIYKGFTAPGGLSTKEDKIGSFVQVFLVFITAVFCWWRLKTKEDKQLAFVWIVTFFLFAFAIKAQSAGNRLVMPYLALWSPLIVLTLSRRAHRGWLLLPLLVWFGSLYWVVDARSRPLLPDRQREEAGWPSEGIEAYFVLKPELLPIFQDSTSMIIADGCTQVGIYFRPDHANDPNKDNFFFEYPFWMMLKEKGFEGTIKHVFVDNQSAMYESADYAPCYIISNIDFDPPGGYSTELMMDGYFLYHKD